MSASAERTRAPTVLANAVTALVIAVMSVAFVLSFASIVYAGPLEPFRGRAIGLALLGSIPMAIIGAVFSSYRGTIVQAQDVTSLLLSVSAASVAGAGVVADDRLFATVAALVLVAGVTTGAAAILVGGFHLAEFGRFIPHSVIGGFLAATGYLLTMGAAGMLVGEQVTIWSLESLLGFDAIARWVPWIAASAAMVYAVKRTGSDLFVLVGLAGSAAVFYVVQSLGGGLDQAEARGLLLGPFDGAGFLGQLDLTEIARAEWSIVGGEIDVIIAVAAMAVLGALLNATGLEVSVGEDVDLDRDLTTTGVANIAAGFSGGLAGFILLSETLLASRLGLRSRWAGLTVATACALTLVFGASLISLVPVGLVATVIAFLGIDLMITWLWVEPQKMPIGDRLVIGLVVLTAATVGFLQAILVGVLTAVLLFVRSYASIDVVWMHSTLVSRRSSVERSGQALDRLRERGDRVLVYELSGYVFFGSASRLLDRLGSDLLEARPETVVIDLARVHGIDTSASAAIVRFADTCRSSGVGLVVTGLASRLEHLAIRDVESVVFVPLLDDAIREIEDRLLHDVDAQPADLVSRLTRGPSTGSEDRMLIPRRHVAAGSHLTKQGESDSLVYYVTAGELRAEVHRDDGRTVVVATFRPGSFIGEISHYAGLPRTADVVAQVDSEVLVIDIDMIEADPRRTLLAAEIHREMAAHLARRLMHTTAALRDRT